MLKHKFIKVRNVEDRYIAKMRAKNQNIRDEHQNRLLKLSCNSRFQRVFTACSCIFKVITLVGSNQHSYFKNANALQ